MIGNQEEKKKKEQEKALDKYIQSSGIAQSTLQQKEIANQLRETFTKKPGERDISCCNIA